MVEKNSMNLIGKLKSIKNCDLILLTTFTFDPIFFDSALLRIIKQNNPGVKIIILIDAKMHDAIRNDFTRETGREYALIPIRKSLFHPKIFAFFSEKKPQLFIGSHNLTLPGLTHNLELSYVTDHKHTVYDCLKYAESIISKVLDEGNPWLKELRKHLNDFETSSESLLITNLNEPILNTVLTKIKTTLKDVDEVIIFAPYFSRVNDLLNKITSSINPKIIKLGIQKHNHDLDINSIKNINNLHVYSVTPKPPNQNRRMHSKFIAFKSGNKSKILVGSPNFSWRALGEKSGTGNYEAGILFDCNLNELIFSTLDFDDISVKEILETSRKESMIDSKLNKYELTIEMAYIDGLGRLHLDYSSELDVVCNLKFFPKGEEYEISIDKNKKTSLISSIPHLAEEVALFKGDKQLSNIVRICNPKGIRASIGYQRGDTQSAINIIQDINEWDDIFLLLTEYFEEPDSGPSGVPVSSPNPLLPSPGIIHSTKSHESLYDLILEILKNTRIHYPNPEPQPNKESKSRSDTTKSIITPPDGQEKIYKIIEKLINKFESQSFPKNSNIKNYVFFLTLLLKILRKLGVARERSLRAVSVLDRTNEILVSYPPMYDKEEDFWKFFFLLIEFALEAEESLDNPYTFDVGTLKTIFPIINKYFDSSNPIVELQKNKSTIQPQSLFKIQKEEHEKNILKKILQAEMTFLRVSQRAEKMRNLITKMIETKEDLIALSCFQTIKLFLEKDKDLRSQVKKMCRGIMGKSKLKKFVNGLLEELSFE